MERYPKDTKISLDDFNNCCWKDATEKADRNDYSSMWQELSTLAKEETDNERFSTGKVLWLLSDACSMSLKPASLNNPFYPMFALEGKRSTLPEDFNDEDIKFFSQIVTFIDNNKLNARISDIVWLMLKPRDPEYALSAIDNYTQVEISTDSFVSDGRNCWDRAIQLCFMLRAGEGDRLSRIENSLVNALENATIEDGYLGLWICDIIEKNRICFDKRETISEKLEELACKFQTVNDLHRAKDYFDSASDWYKKCKNDEKSVEMIIRNALLWEKEAEDRQQSEAPSNMVAASFFENAIQKLRTIPRAHRSSHGIDKKILALSHKVNDAGEKALDEMASFKTEPINITEMIEYSVKSVQGKPTLDALLSFANIYKGANFKNIKEFSEEMVQKHPFQSMFAATQMSKDGRVIAKRPGMDLKGGDNEEVLWPEMVKHYITELGLVVQGYILPALEILRQEHRLHEYDFYSVVKRSPIVPPGRQNIIAKALYLGYDDDFVSSLHLIVPQIENLVRHHLKIHGEKTSNIDSNGIENENGLSTLMNSEKVNDIFGIDLSFELKALFCDPFGPNLRNELAHGLISYEESNSIFSVYAWWLTIRLVFNTFWNANKKIKEPESVEPENA